MRLILDGSGRDLKLALYHGAERLYIHIAEKAKSEVFPELLQDALNELQLGLDEICEVLVHAGPGSFTGLRTSMAFAQSLCYGAERSLKSIGSLEAVALLMQGPVRVAQRANPDAYYVWTGTSGQAGKDEMLSLDSLLTAKEFSIIASAMDADLSEHAELLVDFNGTEWFDALNQFADSLPVLKPRELAVNYVQMTAAEKNLRKSN